MSVYDEARKLGELILKTEQSKRLSDARNMFDNDEEAQRILFEYTDYRDIVQSQMKSSDVNEEEFKNATKVLNEKVEELKKHSIIGELVKAESDFNALVNQTMSILKATITGESPSGNCPSSGCSGCNGCH